MLKSENWLNGSNFAKYSDFIFSEIVTKSEFEKLQIKKSNLIIIRDFKYLKNDSIWYIDPNLNIRENSVIFCQTEVVKILFSALKGVKNLQNLKLITHQSDKTITKTLANKKPKCISEWYSVNVGTREADVVPIPLGLNNFYNKNHFEIDEFSNYLNSDSERKKINGVYVNFTLNTNYRHRFNALKNIQRSNLLFKIDKFGNNNSYIENLLKFKFVLSPWGNGIDTHRFWESIYLGSIPITKKHYLYKEFESLPMILVNDYKEVDSDLLVKKNIEFNPEEIKELNIEHWLKIINRKKIIDKHSAYKLNVSKNIQYNIHYLKFIISIKSKLKIIVYYIKKFTNPRNYYLYFKKLFI